MRARSPHLNLPELRCSRVTQRAKRLALRFAFRSSRESHLAPSCSAERRWPWSSMWTHPMLLRPTHHLASWQGAVERLTTLHSVESYRTAERFRGLHYLARARSAWRCLALRHSELRYSVPRYSAKNFAAAAAAADSSSAAKACSRQERCSQQEFDRFSQVEQVPQQEVVRFAPEHPALAHSPLHQKNPPRTARPLTHALRPKNLAPRVS
jgi:hypothetical protein